MATALQLVVVGQVDEAEAAFAHISSPSLEGVALAGV
jgi:hypothetical protein